MENNLYNFMDKSAFITGGASGLGRRIAQILAHAGARVTVADLNESGAQEVVDGIVRDGGQAMAVKVDVRDPQSIQQAVQNDFLKFGSLDIAVNAAGVAGGRPQDKTAIEIWQHVIDVDLNGVYYCCLAYADIMKKQGSGKIINIASMSATVVNNFPQPPIHESRLVGLPAYCAAKAGVKQLTRVLAAQLARDGILVNSISPGYMETEMTREIFGLPEVLQAIEKETPLARVGKPEDLDGLILYMASETSNFMTGSDIVIDGGYTIW